MVAGGFDSLLSFNADIGSFLKLYTMIYVVVIAAIVAAAFLAASGMESPEQISKY